MQLTPWSRPHALLSDWCLMKAPGRCLRSGVFESCDCQSGQSREQIKPRPPYKPPKLSVGSGTKRLNSKFGPSWSKYNYLLHLHLQRWSALAQVKSGVWLWWLPPLASSHTYNFLPTPWINLHVHGFLLPSFINRNLRTSTFHLPCFSLWCFFPFFAVFSFSSSSHSHFFHFHSLHSSSSIHFSLTSLIHLYFIHPLPLHTYNI